MKSLIVLLAVLVVGCNAQQATTYRLFKLQQAYSQKWAKGMFKENQVNSGTSYVFVYNEVTKIKPSAVYINGKEYAFVVKPSNGLVKVIANVHNAPHNNALNGKYPSHLPQKAGLLVYSVNNKTYYHTVDNFTQKVDLLGE